MKNIWLKTVAFFNTTKLGQFIKSGFITFTGIFIGMLILTPAWNALTGSTVPTIQQFKDLVPVALDSFYRALWACIMVETGIYKYNSSSTEKSNPVIVPKQ